MSKQLIKEESDNEVNPIKLCRDTSIKPYSRKNSLAYKSIFEPKATT